MLAVAAQFFYVAAQAGIFSFFINYMTAEPRRFRRPGTAVADFAVHAGCTMAAGLVRDRQERRSGAQRQGRVQPGVRRLYFLPGGPLQRRRPAAEILRAQDAGAVCVAERVVCLLVFLKLGWISVACVFLSYFFMSIMFPTIFALGIFGLGARAKKASAFIVMAIMGGAILPKLMGDVADRYDMSRGFIVPMFCFAFVAFYGFNWPRFSGADSLQVAKIH